MPPLRRLPDGTWQFQDEAGQWQNVGSGVQEILSQYVSIQDDPRAQGGRVFVRSDGSKVALGVVLEQVEALGGGGGGAGTSTRPPGLPSEVPWPPMKTDPTTLKPVFDWDAFIAISKQFGPSAEAEVIDGESLSPNLAGRFFIKQPDGSLREITGVGQEGEVVMGESLHPSLAGRQFIRQPDGTLQEITEEERQEGRIVQGETLDPGLTGRRFVVQPNGSLQELTFSIGDMIAQAVDKKDWDAATELDDWRKRPDAAQRMQATLDVARSPADYMTVLGMLRGELPIQQPTIGETGELRRIAPLAEPLQQAAEEFFRPRFGTASAGQGRFGGAAPAGEVPVEAGIVPGVTQPLIGGQGDFAPGARFGPSVPEQKFHYAGHPSGLDVDKAWVDSWFSTVQEQAQTEGWHPDLLRERLDWMNSQITPVEAPSPAAAAPPSAASVSLAAPTPRFGGGQPVSLETAGQRGRFGAASLLPKAVRDVGIQGQALAPARQFPELGSLRFRSLQAQRNMLPTERSMFEEGLRLQGVPLEDFLEQEQRTVAGLGARPRLRFRTPRFA